MSDSGTITITDATFRYVIKDFSKLDKQIESPAIIIESLPWRIMVRVETLPNGDQSTAPTKFFGYYIKCDGVKSKSWSCDAQVDLRVISHREDCPPFQKDFQYVFNNGVGRGWPDYMSWNVITDPSNHYIKDDCITLEAFIAASEPEITDIIQCDQDVRPVRVTKETNESIPSLLFIGAGKISQDIIKGILKARPEAAQDILVTAPSDKNLKTIQDLGCQTCLLEDSVLEVDNFRPEFVFLCVRPRIFLKELNNVKSQLYVLMSVLKSQMKLSVMEGIHYPQAELWVQVVLSSAASICKTSVFYLKPQSYQQKTKKRREVFDEQLQRAVGVLRLIGHPVCEITEDLLDVATGLCGSGIGLFLEMIQSMTDAAAERGLSRRDAIDTCARMAGAASDLVLTWKKHPYVIRDEVCLPASTSNKALKCWHELSIGTKVVTAIKASIDESEYMLDEAEKSKKKLCL